jgi:hypothetical protein
MDVVGHAADAKGDGAQLLALRGDQGPKRLLDVAINER